MLRLEGCHGETGCTGSGMALVSGTQCSGAARIPPYQDREATDLCREKRGVY